MVVCPVREKDVNCVLGIEPSKKKGWRCFFWVLGRVVVLVAFWSGLCGGNFPRERDAVEVGSLCVALMWNKEQAKRQGFDVLLDFTIAFLTLFDFSLKSRAGWDSRYPAVFSDQRSYSDILETP